MTLLGFSFAVRRRPSTRWRVVAAAAASIAILATQTGLALAAPPSNDLPAGADAITSIPATITQDTTEATVSTDDLGCGAGGTDQATVWYTLTSSTATTVIVDATTSDYVVGINAFSGAGTPGPLIDCAEQTLRLDVEAATTYYVMFADIDAEANGGQLDVTIDVAPPPIQVDLTVDATGKVNTKTGEATVTGSITCSAATSDTFVDVNLRQPVGRFIIHGFGGADAGCGPTPTTWVATIAGDNGRFGPGKATADVSAFACDPFSCADTFVSTTVRLRK